MSIFMFCSFCQRLTRSASASVACRVLTSESWLGSFPGPSLHIFAVIVGDHAKNRRETSESNHSYAVCLALQVQWPFGLCSASNVALYETFDTTKKITSLFPFAAKSRRKEVPALRMLTLRTGNWNCSVIYISVLIYIIARDSSWGPILHHQGMKSLSLPVTRAITLTTLANFCICLGGIQEMTICIENNE